MSFLFTLFINSPRIILPNLIGWLGWILFILVCVGLLYRSRHDNRRLKKKQWWFFIILLLSAVLSGCFIAFRLSSGSNLPPLNLPEDSQGTLIILFSAIPWMLAAGFLGPLYAAIIAIIEGSFQAFWATHSLFSIPETLFLAILFSNFINQRYRTQFFKIIRHPIAAASLLALIYPFIYFLDVCLNTQGWFVNLIKYALVTLPNASLAKGIELVFGGILVEIIAHYYAKSWGRHSPLVPSPAESSLKARFLFGLIPLGIILIFTLIIGDWVIAGQAAQNLYHNSMERIAQLAASNVPYFFDTGKELINSIADDPRLSTANGETLHELLGEYYKFVPFFSQISILDKEKQSIDGYPVRSYNRLPNSLDEQNGIDYALIGVQSQTYTIPPDQETKQGQISFITPYRNTQGEIQGVVIGRTDLSTNPLIKPTVENLQSLSSDEGIGMLLDEKDRILVHPNPNMLLSNYSRYPDGNNPFSRQTAPDGTTVLTYYQPIEGTDWSVVLTVPEYRAQSLALDIALPMLIIILVSTVVAIIFMEFTLQNITNSLRNLSQEADRMSQGKIGQSFPAEGNDEIGQLRHSFDQMRTNLQAKLDELNKLLAVSQGIASSLDINQVFRPILEAALSFGANSARIVIVPGLLPDYEIKPASFSADGTSDKFAYLDEQLLSLSRRQDRLVITNIKRPKILYFPSNMQPPEAVLSISLRQQESNYGVLWIAFEQHHNFTKEEIEFIIKLSEYATLATDRAYQFMNADSEFHKLNAILDASPDPILVTDQNDILILVNPAALQVLEFNLTGSDHQQVDRIITHPQIVDLLRSTNQEIQTRDIRLTNGQIYLAVAAPISIDGQQMGRICILRDITEIRKADSIKSEFVYTVSHDLRTPLSQMRGYVTMFEMVGSLNDQQKSYLQKIVSNLETMTHMVTNLLDFTRIEAGIRLKLTIFPLREMIDNVINLIQPQALQKHISIDVEIHPDTPEKIEADLVLLQQALFNLVENAVKFSRIDGKVVIQVSIREEQVLLAVIDKGIGVSPLDQQRLFEKYHRSVPFSIKEPRTLGLGLAIVKSIIDLHFGKVWVESQLGKGSTFFIQVPFRQKKEPSKPLPRLEHK